MNQITIRHTTLEPGTIRDPWLHCQHLASNEPRTPFENPFTLLYLKMDEMVVLYQNKGLRVYLDITSKLKFLCNPF